MAVDGADWLVGGRYEVIERIGSGGMADVFRAHDRLLDRDVALKIFRTQPPGGDDANLAQRRELELQALARMSHPNLVTLYDGSVADGGPNYLVLELVPGPDLATRLRDGALAEPGVRLIGAQVAEALSYVHARGLVHRDVKPANILLGEDLGPAGPVRARLSDFGIVRMIGAQGSTSAAVTVGTAPYIAPEQARNAEVEPAADVYSLGLVLIEALTGARCFDGPMQEAILARLVRPPAVPADLPHPWPELLTAMTSLDPARRPSATDVAESLRAADPSAFPVDAKAVGPLVLFAADEPEEALPAANPHRTRWAGSALVALAGLALAAVLAGASYVLLGGTASNPGGGSPPTTAPSGSGSASISHSHRSAGVADLRQSLSTSSATHRHVASRSAPAGTASRIASVVSSQPQTSSAPVTSQPPPSSSAPPSSSPPPAPPPTSSPPPTGA